MADQRIEEPLFAQWVRWSAQIREQFRCLLLRTPANCGTDCDGHPCTHQDSGSIEGAVEIANHLARFDTAWRARIIETRILTSLQDRGFPQM